MRLRNLDLLIVVFMSAAGFVGCSGSQDNTHTAANSERPNTAANTNTSPNDTGKIGYPPHVADDFVRGCEGQGVKPELCRCIFEKIREKYSFEDFQVIESEINSGQPPNHFIEFSDKARVECLK